MDVDKAIEFLLQSGARLDARQDRFERELETMARVGRETARRVFAGIRRNSENIDRLTARMDQMTVRMDGFAAQSAARQAEQAEAQAKSDAKFNALMDLLHRRFSGNGHT
ncbi:MAG TPA: hypothetical protein VN515_00225 [Terriglobales bacterium]|nr:hypothetical protein [Terriglobales bacterium]